MKNISLLLSLILFFSCFSQEKKSLNQMNEDLLKSKEIFPFSMTNDSVMIRMLTKGYTTYRLLGAQSCGIKPDKKYSQVYIEDGFHDEKGFYDGIIIIDNKNICEITTSPYKLHQDSLSYTKVKERNILYGEIFFYTKKLSLEEFENKYTDEYFRYKLVTQGKMDAFKKCLAIDKYTPKSIINARNYYYDGKGIKTYSVPIKYSDIKNGIEGLPYFQEDKKKEFTECINKLDILKIHNSSNIETSSVSD